MQSPFTSPSKRTPSSGFTLIELLTVIAIIGILAGILVPVVSNAIVTAKKTKCSVQMQDLVTAATMYKQEYKYWPTLQKTPPAADYVLSILAFDAPFIRVMSGKPNPGDETAFNKKLITFASFADTELSPDGQQLIDPFQNTDLYMVFDTDGNHLIASNVVNGIVMTSYEGKNIQVDQGQYDVHAECIAMSPGPGTTNSQAVTTWAPGGDQ